MTDKPKLPEEVDADFLVVRLNLDFNCNHKEGDFCQACPGENALARLREAFEKQQGMTQGFSDDYAKAVGTKCQLEVKLSRAEKRIADLEAELKAADECIDSHEGVRVAIGRAQNEQKRLAMELEQEKAKYRDCFKERREIQADRDRLREKLREIEEHGSCRD
jgi:DNA repair exonuclease SbcCD ATPase subunit